MKPVIAITMGDYNGIGPEIILKAVTSSSVKNICSPLVIGSIDVFEFYARKQKLKFNFKEVDHITSTLAGKTIPVFHIRKFQSPIIKPGIISVEAGTFAGEALEISAKLCLQNAIDGIVTAPVSKDGLHKAGYIFSGQTEMLAKFSETNQFMMMLVADKLRVALTTIHLPLRRVSQNISKEIVASKLILFHRTLQNDFKIKKPRIAVLGLNPHAGENGQLGSEEIQHIQPAIRSVNQRGIVTDGPFAADGFWGTHTYKNYDAVLAMYHDQGLIPLKLLGFDIGVNYSAGLPFVRTSPDHGTAYEIAGKGIANPSSMIEAIRLAAQIIKNRKRKLS
ncbi:MAG: 4-hydroxythreonine-4-phosphate dehydrogenase PdxA [Ignavibacteriales bacterium]|nr:4-hydroxythreonine-4-phosphate dehydrogenase PdxA [Ignavibacteriales bacterium]